MGLLEDLKRQAEERQKDRQQLAEAGLARDLRYDQLIIPKMREIHAFLRELVDYVKIAELKIESAYAIPNFGKVEFGQYDYSVRIGNVETPTWILLGFQCRRECPLTFSVQPREQAENTGRFLQEHHFQFVEYPIRGAGRVITGLSFEVQARFPVQFRIEADKDKGLIHVLSINFEGFSAHRDSFPPEKIDDEWKDDFGNYLLRRSTRFRYRPIPEEERQAIRQAIEEIRRKKECR